MKRLGTAQKVLYSLTAVGGLLIVVALALFALGGSGLGADMLRGTAGFVLGMITVQLLTKSPRRGRRVAALLLLASVIGFLAFLIAQVVLLPSNAEDGRRGIGFVVGLLSSMMGASVWRLLGVNPMGPRGDQASRRRS